SSSSMRCITCASVLACIAADSTECVVEERKGKNAKLPAFSRGFAKHVALLRFCALFRFLLLSNQVFCMSISMADNQQPPTSMPSDRPPTNAPQQVFQRCYWMPAYCFCGF